MTIRIEDFISVSKKMVTEFYNTFMSQTDEKLSINDIIVVGFHKSPDCYRIILETPDMDSLFYEVIWDAEKGEIQSYTYKKTDSLKRKKDERRYKNSKYYREKIN